MCVKVLIVEDEALLAMCLTDQVTELGHSVCGTARDEHDALAMGTNHKPVGRKRSPLNESEQRICGRS